MLPGQTLADRIRDLVSFVELAEKNPRYARHGANVIHGLKRHVKLGTPEWDQVYALGVRLHEVAWMMLSNPSPHVQSESRLVSAQVSAALVRLELKDGDLPLTRWQTLTPEACRTIQMTPGLLDYRGRRTLIDSFAQ